MLKANKVETSRSRGGRLARRARSFKEDFLGRINQIRSPSGTRTGSPCKNAKNKIKTTTENQADEAAVSSKSKEVDSILHSVHLLSTDLRYFQDVVEKNILEMLPGSATVILETVLNIHSVLRESLVSEQSSLMLSASNQVYQTLANLICWSDNVLLYGEKAVEKESVGEIVQAVRDAVKSLVHLSLDRLQHKDNRSATDIGPQYEIHSSSKHESPHRNSLPDIPLTPREREILEETKFSGILPSLPQLHHSASSDSILGKGNPMILDRSQPPPKPPLPVFREGIVSESVLDNQDTIFNHDFQLDSAPPLPPKKKPGFLSNLNFEETGLPPGAADSAILFGSYGSINTELSSIHAQEWSSPHNQSPENLTPFSKSSASSLDSNLNNSIDDLLSFGQFRRVQCSQAHHESCIKHSVVSDLTSQTYNCELSSYSSTMATTATSISLHSGDFESNDMLSRIAKDSDLSKNIDTNEELKMEPPALPIKLRTMKNRTVSQYDNLPQFIVSDLEGEYGGHSIQCPRAHSPQSWLSGNHSLLCPHHQTGTDIDENGKPPPLPPKKKTIMAYMQMFGSYSQPSESEFLRHSVHTYKVVQADWQQVELSFMQQRSFTSSYVSSSEDSVFLDGYSYNSSEKGSEMEELIAPNTPPVLPPKKSQMNSNTNYLKGAKSPSILPLGVPFMENSNCQNTPSSHCFEKPHWHTSDNIGDNSVENEDHGALDELEASEHLICKKLGEEGPDIRGGSVDSLIVQATKATKNDFLYQEAFLTTYRTFISPYDLVSKLLYRYNKFIHMSDMRQRAARNSFALLVRVVDDMCLTDVTEEILKILMDFICQLVSRGDLLLARALRKKVVEKCASKQRSILNVPILLPSMAVTTHKASILDFKSESIAEQMTVLDADLFQKIEIPEVLLWAKEQKEELSPNLTTFTEHFNKMSYWARTRILEQEEAKDRERYVVKFIKVMKYLRKLNNFNSYLAILSALDSAPIRRLEWQRNITEGLKEYCALIDSSSSFRAYRQALAETGPPCIPYIGLILQDLTFVHIGNNDFFAEGSVNFSKRWQQFNILDNMRRFKHCQYSVKRNEQIISFFNNFDDYLCEEAMWQISETIKPRGGKKKSCDHT